MSDQATHQSSRSPRTTAHRGQIIPSILAVAALALLGLGVLVPTQPPAPPQTDTLTGDQLNAIAERLAERLSDRLAIDLDRRLDRHLDESVATIARTEDALADSTRVRTDRALARLETAAAAALDRIAAATEPVQALGPPEPIAPDRTARRDAEPNARARDDNPASPTTPPKRAEADQPVQPTTPRTGTASNGAARTINVNDATRAELELLPGIGPALARRIIESRRTAGPFRRLDDLQRVPGIGPKTAAALEPHVRFD